MWKTKIEFDYNNIIHTKQHAPDKDGQDEQDEECFFLEGMKEFLGDNSNSLKEVLGKGRNRTIRIV